MSFEEQIRQIVREELARAQRSAGAAAVYSSRRLPPDLSCAATFNRACRSGGVRGAEKHGRSWVCSVDAWSEYRRSVARQSPAKAPVAPAVEDILVALGAKRVA
jgi:hypothetical protein